MILKHEKLNNIKYDFLYSPITIDLRFQVSSKLFFGKRNAVINFLNAEEEFYYFIQKNIKMDYKKMDWKDIPIDERFFKKIKTEYNSYKYECLDLPIQINRQKFVPNKPYWMLDKDLNSSNFNPIIRYFQ